MLSDGQPLALIFDSRFATQNCVRRPQVEMRRLDFHPAGDQNVANANHMGDRSRHLTGFSVIEADTGLLSGFQERAVVRSVPVSR